MSKDLTPRNAFELIEEQPGENLPLAGSVDPGSGVGPHDFDDEEGGANLGRYLAAVKRYKWLILLLTVLGTAGGVFLGGRMSPSYQTAATLWVERANREEAQRGPIRPAELLEASSWLDLLRSLMVMEHVVHEQRLFLSHPTETDSTLLAGLRVDERVAGGRYRLAVDHTAEAFTLRSDDGTVLQRGAFGEPVGSELGIRWQPDLSSFPEGEIAFSLRPPRDVAARLGEQLMARLDRDGNFLQISMQGRDPEQITDIINTTIHRYVDVAAELKRARLDELTEILAEQLNYAETQLREAEIALEDFRVRTITLPSDRSTPVAAGLAQTRDPVFDNFFSMRVELEEVRRDQDAISAALRSGSTEQLESVGAVQQSSALTATLQELSQKQAEIRSLRYSYTEEHPSVQRLAEEIETLESSTIPNLARGVMNELSTREGQLTDRIDGASDELARIPTRSIEEARLTRQVAITDNLYTTLQRRYEEARLAAASSIPDLRILNEAVVPQQPANDPKLQMILLAFIGSLGLGIGGAILRDRLDPRLRYPEQVTGDLGLSIIAGIPSLRKKRGRIRPDSQRQAQEAFRSLRLNLLHAYGTAGPIVLTISSPGPGDGKSFVTSNLGLSFAELGRRTVVIDADLRRGVLHRNFAMDRKPGLTETLRGTARGPVVRATSHDNLFILPGGSRVSDGPELLSSKQMRDLIMRLRSEFEVVIVDSPPLGAGVDPFALGTITGNMLLVLRTGETDRQMADAKLELLERLPIRLLGAVLNGVPKTREYRYYSYLSGYEAHDEIGRDAAIALPGA
ncbi:MAG TPA: polysaccharide biosynthesis tyrosine autokinase [Longimicrobiales bacterium]|nr:polysaccharide biosynthesis tyrosine autokinase [Longimicrobiales bacterium]